jgi:predicted enzyme related to lactoylglutathione lyase
MGQPVTWFEVLGRDREKLQGFYSGLFDWKIDDSAEMKYGMVQPENGIPGGVGESPDGGAGHVTFYVSVDDVNAAAKKAEELGGTTVMAATDLPQVTIALIADPEGHVVGLMKMREG